MGILSFFDSKLGGRTRDVSDKHGLPVQLSGSIVGDAGAAAPTEVAQIGGKYSVADPAHDDGDLVPLRVNAKGEVFVNLASALSAVLDSIDVAKMSKGSVTTAHAAITANATSEEIPTVGFNAVKVWVEISVAAKNWTFKVQDCAVSGGTFADAYEQVNTGVMTLMSYQCNATRSFIFKGIGDYIKIVATEDEDGATVTVKVQPLNL